MRKILFYMGFGIELLGIAISVPGSILEGIGRIIREKNETEC